MLGKMGFIAQYCYEKAKEGVRIRLAANFSVPTDTWTLKTKASEYRYTTVGTACETTGSRYFFKSFSSISPQLQAMVNLKENETKKNGSTLS